MESNPEGNRTDVTKEHFVEDVTKGDNDGGSDSSIVKPSYHAVDVIGGKIQDGTSSSTSNIYVKKVRENFPLFNRFDENTPIRFTDKQIEQLIERYPRIIDMEESEFKPLWNKIFEIVDHKGKILKDTGSSSEAYEDFLPRTISLLDPNNEIPFLIREEMSALNIGDFLDNPENSQVRDYFLQNDSADIIETYTKLFDEVNVALFLTETFRDLAKSGVSPINWVSILKNKEFKDIKNRDASISNIGSVLMAVRNNKINWDYGLKNPKKVQLQYGILETDLPKDDEVIDERKKTKYSLNPFQYIGNMVTFFSRIYKRVGRSNEKERIIDLN